MIGGGGCRIEYVMWMDRLLPICVACLAAVNTAAMNTRLSLSCNDQDDTCSSKPHCTTTTFDDSNESGNTQMLVPSTRSVSPANVHQTSDFGFTTMLATLPSSLSPIPLAKVESFIDALSAKLSPFPTIPSALQHRLDELKCNAIVLPQKHCAFRSCTWQGDEEASLIEHVTGHHKASFAHVDQSSHACITMHTICTKKPLPTLNVSACPSLVLQLMVALLLHSRNATEMKRLCHSYVAYVHKFIVWILTVMEGHQFNGIPHSTPTMEDLFLGCAKKTPKDYSVSPHIAMPTEPKTLA